MYSIHHHVITINPHQAYINISTQQFNIYIIHHFVTRQWPLAEASESIAEAIFMLTVATSKLAVATNLNIEGSSIRAYLLQRGTISLQWVLLVSTSQSTNPNPSLLIAARSNLVVASTHGFDQPSHITICAYQQNWFITTQLCFTVDIHNCTYLVLEIFFLPLWNAPRSRYNRPAL